MRGLREMGLEARRIFVIGAGVIYNCKCKRDLLVAGQGEGLKGILTGGLVLEVCISAVGRGR